MPSKASQIRAALFKWNRTKNERYFFWRQKRLNLFQFVMIELLLQKTRAENAERIIKSFVKIYKFPNSVLRDNKNKLKKIIKPLGLQNQRLKAIFRIANYFKSNKEIDAEKLGEVSGIGHYMVAAVKCFYLDQRVPILDVNTSRIVSRLFNISNKVDLRKNKKLLEKSKQFIPRKNFKKFNWILLDFGAVICKSIPLCSKCPLRAYCSYYREKNR